MHHHVRSPLLAGVPTALAYIDASCHTIDDGACLYLHQILAIVDVIGLYDALKKMRQLTDYGIPFSFEFYSYNSTKGISEGYKIVHKGLLRQGMRKNQSDKAEVLIGYVNHTEGGNRFFNLPLLMKFNGINIKP